MLAVVAVDHRFFRGENVAARDGFGPRGVALFERGHDFEMLARAAFAVCVAVSVSKVHLMSGVSFTDRNERSRRALFALAVMIAWNSPFATNHASQDSAVDSRWVMANGEHRFGQRFQAFDVGRLNMQRRASREIRFDQKTRFEDFARACKVHAFTRTP